MADGLDDVTELDGDNAKWTRAYLDGLAERLAREEAREPRDAEMIAYLLAEQARYAALVERVGPR
ncbi:MAG: hypothetical protein VKQ33_02820 [Candidatus Sericytochromatia bacterium]|nr:hypothetical protein [Candidatus Sericytochromatia bacterium]